MRDGKAELHNPETNELVATFTERCRVTGAAGAKVVLKHPITLSGTERLAIFSNIKDQEIIAVTAKNGEATEIHEFSGESSLGCLPVNTQISLTQSPGGPLGTLLIVLAKGTIHEEHH
jgi:hypothetical protein